MHENGVTKPPPRPSALDTNKSKVATSTLQTECTSNVSDARSKFEQALLAAAGSNNTNVKPSANVTSIDTVNKKDATATSDGQSVSRTTTDSVKRLSNLLGIFT